MASQFSVAMRNAKLAAYEATLGTASVIKWFTGAMPADVATADSGTLLVTFTQPTDYMAAPASGSVAKQGVWSGTAVAAGTVGYFRHYQSDGTTCHHQGTVTATGGGGDMTVDNAVIANAQSITINTFTLTSGNA